jgi:predicted  nucleic acid-binding Zn-ribbon protein
MSDLREQASEPAESRGLLLEDVARAAAELAAESELDGLLARFMDRVREWGAPSAVLAAVRDPSAESGWRLLPALSFGSGPLGAERSLPQLVESTPGCLERPTLVHPEGDVPGVRPRDNCIIPWLHGGESGILVLRGLPRPSPPNLGQAVAILAAPVWPRLLGGPAERIESLLAQLQRVAERLGEDAARQIERLRASQTPVAGGESGDVPAEPARVAELERELDAVRQAAQGSELELRELRERTRSLEAALKESEAERERTRGDVEKHEARAALLHSEHATALKRLEDRCRSAEAAARTAEEVRTAQHKELEEARAEIEHSSLDWDEVRGRLATLEETLKEVKAERDRVRDEAVRLSSRLESLRQDNATTVEKLEERRRTAETALRKALEDLTEAQRELKLAREAKTGSEVGEGPQEERVSELEKDLKAARAERDRARSAAERAEEQRGVAEKAATTAQEELQGARKELATARDELSSVREELGTARDELITAGEGLAAAQRKLKNARKAREKAEGAGPEEGRQAIEILSNTQAVLRRTPFVPPGLRGSLEETEALVGGKDDGEGRWFRVVLLDRDVASLEPLANELEDAGIDVKIANYPEELALLMKTPEAQKLDAIICDILAFRPDQTVAGLFRGWEKDRPGLSFFVSFSADDPAETERTNRVPLSLTAGRLQRPIPAAELIEKLRVLSQRQGTS